MTEKDYEILCRAISQCFSRDPEADSYTDLGVEYCARNIASAFKREYRDDFDKRAFLLMCNV